MKIGQKYKILMAVFSGTCITALVAYYLGYDPKVLIGFGTIIFIMIFALWDMPPKHKEFSDTDRLKATNTGCSPPPELWTPDMPLRGKRHKNKRTDQN